MAAHRYWRLWCVENFGNSFAGNMAASSIEMRVNSGGSNLSVSGSGTPSASAFGGAGFESDKAFDANTATYWYSGSVALPTWIKWDFGVGNSQDINYLTIINGTSPVSSQMIKRWTLQYSDDDANWTPWMYSTSNNTSAQTNTPTSWAWASDMVPSGTLNVTLPVLSLSSRTGGSSQSTLPALTLAAAGSYSLNATLPSLTLESRSGAVVSLQLPSLRLAATGNELASTLDITLPSLTLSALGGASLKQTLPAITIAASGTAPIIATLDAPLPILALSASGTVTMVGSLRAALPAVLGSGAAGGARGSFDLPALTFSGAATVGLAGTVRAVLPLLTITATATAQNYGRLDAELPALERVNAGLAARALPMLTLRASGYAVVAIEHAAWAVNLLPGQGMPNQVSEYTNFPFNQIIRYGDDYYGVADDGLYLLGGDTDYASPTPTPIPWSWRTAITDFGSRQMKVVRESVHYGRLGASATATVAVAEGAQRSYAALIERGESAQAHRIKYGKGLKGVYWQFGMSDTSGSAMELDASTYDALPTSRKI